MMSVDDLENSNKLPTQEASMEGQDGLLDKGGSSMEQRQFLGLGHGRFL